MIKKILALLIAFICIFQSVSIVFAHGSQYQHDADLRRVLFGEGYIPTGEKKEKFQRIANNENSRLQLQRKLEKIATKAKHIHHDNIRTQEVFDEYKEYSREVVSALRDYVPDMLRREDFFANAFYK